MNLGWRAAPKRWKTDYPPSHWLPSSQCPCHDECSHPIQVRRWPQEA